MMSFLGNVVFTHNNMATIVNSKIHMQLTNVSALKMKIYFNQLL